MDADVLDLATRCARRHATPQDFDDLRQELLIAGWLASQKFEPERGLNYRGFLWTRMEYAVSDFYRNGQWRKRGRNPTTEPPERRQIPLGQFRDDQLPGTQEEGYELVELAEEADRAHNYLRATLEPEYLELFERHYIGGETQVALAVEFGYSPTGGMISQKIKVARTLAQFHLRGQEAVMDLKPRQREVMTMMVQGATDKQIAERLVLSPFTVKTHARFMFQALGVSSRPELAGRKIADGSVVMGPWSLPDGAWLTTKELRVLRLMACGYADDRIEREAGFPVKHPIRNLRAKFGTGNRVNIITRGFRARLWTARDLPVVYTKYAHG